MIFFLYTLYIVTGLHCSDVTPLLRLSKTSFLGPSRKVSLGGDECLILPF